jgi:hypothetical protein
MKNSIFKILQYFIIFILFSCYSYSQDNSRKQDSSKFDYFRSSPDSVYIHGNAKRYNSDELRKTEIDSAGFAMQKSPLRAIICSIVPGAGQIYVENYWKAPLFAGAAGVLAYMVIDYHNDYSIAENSQKKYEQLLKESSPSINTDYIEDQIEIMKRRKDFYNNQRDMSAFYLLGVYVIATIDAYVGAHLYDFNIDDNLSIMLLPNMQMGASLNFAYTVR